ncbi:hypothetical protein EYB25_009794 [Talaromyces marneffei]|nr:hypothetical protein EYB25_009794 [Talaromyces marneffei]
MLTERRPYIGLFSTEFIDARDTFTFTPLHLASKNGHGDTIKILLDYRADVEARLATTSKEPNRTALALAIGFLLQSKPKEEISESSKLAIFHLARESEKATKRNALYRAQMSLDILDQLTSVFEAMKPSDDRDDAYPKESDLEQTKFIWWAMEPERHHSLLAELKGKAKPLNKDEASLDLADDSVLQWAAYHGYYVVVYWLLRNSEPRPKDNEANNRKKAVYITGQMLQLAKRHKERSTAPPVEHSNEEDQQPKPRKKAAQSVPANNERTQDEMDSSGPNNDIQRFQYTLDMLRDPPIGTDNGATTGDCKAPSLQDKSDKESISRNYEATLVDFYSRGSRVDLFRRQRPIFDVIYETDNGGPDGVMKMATSILKEVNPGDSLETENDPNNMEWMEHVVQRVCHDNKQSERHHATLRDFLRGSWREMPLGDSSAKFMNPCFVNESRKSDPLNAKGGGTRGERRHDRRIGETEKKHDETEDEQEQEMDQGDQEDNVTFKENRDPEKTQKPYVPSSSPAHALVKGSLDKPQTPAALYIPYLTFEKCYRRPCICEHEIRDPSGFRTKCDNMLKVYNKRGIKGQVVHKIRSLDEFYYPNLPDLTSRNAAQVATRYLTLQSQGNRKENGDWWPILAVGQLWLWVIDEKTIISSSTAGYCGTGDPVVEGIFNQLREQMEQGGSTLLPSTVYQLSRLIVKYCINFTRTASWNDVTRELEGSDKYTEKSQELSPLQGNLLQMHGDKSPFEIFADSINRAADSENSLFERFVNQVERNKNESRREKSKEHNNNDKQKTKLVSKTKQQGLKGKGSTGKNQCSHGHSKTGDGSEAKYSEETDEMNQANEHEDWEAIYDAAKLLGEVKDIQDELHMFKAVVADQESVWNTLTGLGGNDRRLAENKSLMERGSADILEELEEMNRLVDSIETSVKDTLNLEQNGINITEAMVSRQLTEQSTRQGRSIMAFTIVTIFFLPMSFLTSMFALNVTSFQHDASGNLLYQPTFIFPIIFCVSIGLGIMIIIPALFYPNIGEFWKHHLNSQHMHPRMNPHHTSSQNPTSPKNPNQEEPVNITTPQIVNPMHVPQKGTDVSLKPLESYLRNLRSSLHSRRRSEIVDTEKAELKNPE